MTSLKTSIKTITYLSDTGCLEIQGASLTVEKGKPGTPVDFTLVAKDATQAGCAGFTDQNVATIVLQGALGDAGLNNTNSSATGAFPVDPLSGAF